MDKLQTPLKVYLLGGFKAEVQQQPLHFRSDKIRALLAYLALTPNLEHSRAALATLVWSEQSTSKAFANLRVSLLRLRESLSPVLAVAPTLLVITQHTVTFNLSPRIWVDVLAFDALLNSHDADRHANPDYTEHSEGLDSLAQAAALYHGALLQNFASGDSPAFEEWLVIQRERRHQRMQVALHTLALHALSHHRADLAQAYAQRHIELDPWHEEGHRLVMLAWRRQGNTAAALAHYEAYRNTLRKELAIEPSAVLTSFADYLSSVQSRKFTSIARELSARPAHNLPAALTTFVGREQEVTSLTTHIADTSYALLSLVGVGGIGKSRLALQVAHQLADTSRFPDGIWWCELSLITDPAHIALTVQNVLGLREQGQQSSLALVQAHLKDRRTLLILDNCEHLIEACARFVETLAQTCPHIKILTTSRESLNLPAESVWHVPTLIYPPVQTVGALPSLDQLDQLARFEAIRLFLERAAQVEPAFKLTERNAAAIVKIARQLDGIPLALELAVARLKALSVEQIAARMDDLFGLLNNGNRTVLPRHQTLRATLDWSYNLLEASECILLRRLSVFSGGWTLEDAEAICGEGADLAGKGGLLSVLTRLVDKSLVVREMQKPLDHHEIGPSPRYRMLEPIRQYADGKLEEAAERDLLRHRHLRHFLTWMERAESQINTNSGRELLGSFSMEHGNIRAALAWAWACERDIENARWLAGLLNWFWIHTDHLNEASGWYARVLDPTRGLPATRGRAMALMGAGTVATFLNHFDEAGSLLEQSIALWQTLDDPWRLAWCLYRLAYLLIQLEDNIRASLLFAEHETLFRSAGDYLLLVLVLGWWAKARIDIEIDHDINVDVGTQQEDADIKRMLDEALSLGRIWQDSRCLFATYQIYGYRALVQGNHSAACRDYRESLRWRREWGVRWVILTGLRDLADALCLSGDDPQAMAFYQEALGLARDLGDQRSIVGIQHKLAVVALHLGDMDAAQSLLAGSLTACFRWSDMRGILTGLCGFAELRRVEGCLDVAVSLCSFVQKCIRTRPLRLSHYDKVMIERNLTSARRALSASDFETAWASGQRLTLIQAVAVALALDGYVGATQS